MAKEFWFFGVVALMLFYSAIQLLIKNERIKNEGNENKAGIKKETLRIELNIIDILLLAFYSWCFIRAIFTPYTPFYHNHKLQILTGMMVVYFFVKNVVKTGHLLSLNRQSWSLKGSGKSFNSHWSLSHLLSFGKRKMTREAQMTTTDARSANDHLMTAAGQLSTTDERSSTDAQQMTNGNSFILSFLIFSFILSGFLQAIYGLLQLYGIYPSHHNLFKITGSFFNPAPYAMYLAVVFPVALGKALFNEYNTRNEITEIIKARNYSFIPSFLHSFIHHVYSFIFSSFIPKYLPFATVIAILLILPATMNRASWLGATTGSLVVLQYRYNWWGIVKQWLNTRTKKLLAITGSIVIIGGICVSLFYLKAGSSNGRLFIWEVTLGKIAEKPLFGHGLGRFEAEYNNWQAEYFMKHPEEMDGPKGWVAGNTKYAFNEYLEIASETGIIGLLLFFILLFFALVSSVERKVKIISTPFILTIVILSFFSFPFYNLPLFMVLLITLSIISAYKQALPIKIQTKPIILTNYLNSLISLVFGMWLIYILPKKYSLYKTWRDTFYNNYALEVSAKQFENIYASFKYNNEFLQQFGKCLEMNSEYTRALIHLNEARKYGGDYMLYANLGDVYKKIKEYPKAEIEYNHSAYMIPHKLYPNYLLVILYKQNGNNEKAIAKAKEVFNMKVKIENTALKEIKDEMYKIINKKGKTN
ncbi:MAG: hypothetical protein HC831_03965 [Chloroflexia bacterium]|nr:hypothetical protein [Chloroflexia bacterium]